jgi:putative solute:sodium symporter small subunit
MTFFARDLQFSLAEWPFSYWFAAQGALFAFIGIVVFYAWAMRRLAPEDSDEARDGGA